MSDTVQTDLIGAHVEFFRAARFDRAESDGPFIVGMIRAMFMHAGALCYLFEVTEGSPWSRRGKVGDIIMLPHDDGEGALFLRVRYPVVGAGG